MLNPWKRNYFNFSIVFEEPGNENKESDRSGNTKHSDHDLEDELGIEEIEFGFKNEKLINLLKERGYHIGEQKFKKKYEKVEKKLVKLF